MCGGAGGVISHSTHDMSNLLSFNETSELELSCHAAASTYPLLVLQLLLRLVLIQLLVQ